MILWIFPVLAISGIPYLPQLAKENKKFVYNLVKPGARAREYEDALLWLSHAGLIQRVFRNEKPTIPLSAYDDLTAFKIYLSDVGLLRRMAKVPPSTIVLTYSVLAEFIEKAR